MSAATAPRHVRTACAEPAALSPVLGIVGRSGSGKTTLITALIGLLGARGLRVSTVKHTHHAVDLDQPGKDSWRHRQAGAHEVLLAGAERWALLHERRGDEAGLESLLARLEPVDLVLVEGFGRTPGPRLEVQRSQVVAGPDAATAGKRPLWPEDPAIEAVASDAPIGGCDRHWLHLDNTASISGWIIARLGLPDQFS